MVDKKTGLKQKKVVSNKKDKKPALAKSKDIKVSPEVAEEIQDKITKAEDRVVTKAGKHSAKATKEAAVEQARQERKKDAAGTEQEKPKVIKKPPRSRVERAGKRYRETDKLIDRSKLYSLSEALDLAVKTSPVKFDATVELHVNLAVDPKIADQNVRDSVTLPAGTGKTLRVAVFAEGDEITSAKAAGADIVGDADFLAQLDKEIIDFDILITGPRLMARLGKYAKLLGPKGLMPNPKSGTITTDIPKAIKDSKSGRVEYRVDQAGIIHLGIGKVSFGAKKLLQNAEAVLASIAAAKPSSFKGLYINSVYVTTSMGPSIKVQI